MSKASQGWERTRPLPAAQGFYSPPVSFVWLRFSQTSATAVPAVSSSVSIVLSFSFPRSSLRYFFACAPTDKQMGSNVD